MRKAWACGGEDTVMTRKFDIALTRSDMHSLKDGAWLNDKIIDFYLEMIVERSNNGPGPK